VVDVDRDVGVQVVKLPAQARAGSI